MESFSINGVVQAEYKYNYLGQQAIRTLTQTGQVINSVYGPDGNRMADFEYDPVAGSSSLLREYVWFEGKPVAVVEGGVVYFVRTDHIGRPVFATDGTGAKVWEATYLPFGGVHTSSGSPIALRFPGQWFQSESGLHQNWMRDYDPTTGRYIQADPLGLVDGASVYGYAGQNPGRYVDPTGLISGAMSKPFVPSLSDGDLLQCSLSDDCYEEFEQERGNCFNNYQAGIIKQIHACLDRAGYRNLLCRRGIAHRPPEWTKEEEPDNMWNRTLPPISPPSTEMGLGLSALAVLLSILSGPFGWIAQ